MQLIKCKNNDNDRQIDSICYNLLNLPTTILFHNGNRTEYGYRADGRKQRAYYRTMTEPLLMNGDSITGQHVAEEVEVWYSGNREKYRVRGQDSVWRWYKEIVYNDEGYTEFALNDTTTTDIQQYYYRKDHLGNIVAVWNATQETTPQRTFYYASGLPMSISTGQDLQARKYSGKAFDEMHGLNEYDSEARRYYPAICRTTTVDPLCEKYYSASPYAWCGNNPINAIDPNGEKWFYYPCNSEIEDHRKEFFWEDEDFIYKTLEDGSEIKLQGYDAIVVFEGSMNETLGENKNIYGEGAITANVTVYGPTGKDDIQNYTGFTMTSDFKTFGAIADGEYNVIYKVPGKSGSIPSNYAVNNAEPVDCINGINPSPIEYHPYSNTQKNGIYVHRTNRDGSVKVNYEKKSATSTGCLLIAANQWEKFSRQIGNRGFKLILTRDR